MKIDIKIPLLFVGIFFGEVMNAQTVNTGDLFITPGTQFSTVSDFNNTPSGVFVNDGEAFIYSHFNNDGAVDFTTNLGGYTRFQGAVVQQLTGGNISYFYDVLFDNASSNEASFELSTEISIENEAEFDEGIVKNDDFGGLVIFQNDADHIGTFDGSHVDGHVQKNGDSSFEYPIGDSQLYRYAAISAPDSNGDVFTAKYFLENPDTNYPLENRVGVIDLIDNNEYWTITREAGSSEVLVTLSWNSATTPDEVIESPQLENIRIVRWDEGQQLWVDEGGIVDIDNKTVTSPLTIEDYGVFTLGRVKTELILPGDVVIYNAVTPNGDGDNDYFIIDNIQNLPNNQVEIFNRWGVKVFSTTNYDTNDNVFNGYSNGRLTINFQDQLPTGTYFYILNYDYTRGGVTDRIKQAGYLYLTTE